jgi:hypothetical protein
MTSHPPAGGVRRVLSRLSVVAVAASAVALAPSSVLAQRTAVHQRAAAAALTCTVSTMPGRPVTFSPPLRSYPQRMTSRGTLRLTRCASPSGAARRRASGRLDYSGSGTASCTSAGNLRGHATIAWRDVRGRGAGVSHLTSSTRTVTKRMVTLNPADPALSGKVDSGPLAGRSVTGSATADLAAMAQQCSSRGIGAVSGSGTVVFR